MQSNPAFLNRRMRLNLGGKDANRIVVEWRVYAGSTVDDATQANTGDETVLSGVMRGWIYEIEAKNVEREYVEIDAGDIILETLPEGMIEIVPGQILSGTTNLDAVKNQGVRLRWRSKLYSSKQVGSKLAEIVDCVMGEAVQFERTSFWKIATG